MNSILVKSYDDSRAQLFGLLISCLFSPSAKGSCPFSKLRINLSTEEKYEYVMGLTKGEIKCMLLQHQDCYESRLCEINGLNNDQA